MVEYLKNGPFSVQMGGNQSYRDNHDRIFGKKPEAQELARLADDGGITSNPDVNGCIVENYTEGEVAPQSDVIEAGAEKIDVQVNVHFTEENERKFNEAMAQPFDESEFVPLRAVRGTIQQQVREFHRVYGQPILTGPMVPPKDRMNLRLRLIAEEFFELLAACGVDHGMYYDPSRINVDPDCVDLVEVADALADIAYVVEGANLEFGIDSETVLEEVQRSNMTKLGDDGLPVYNADGKVTKGPNYSEPDIRGVLGL